MSYDPFPFPKSLPRTAEVVDAALARMEKDSEKNRGFAILGMQVGGLQVLLSHSPAREWLLHHPDGVHFRHRFSEFIMNIGLASDPDPVKARANIRELLSGLSAFTQDVTGKDPGRPPTGN